MRVLYVNQTAQVSGAERSLLGLLRGLEGSVERVVACPEGELAEEVRALGVRHEPISGTVASFRLHPRHTARGLLDIGRSALQVRRLVSRLRPDLVHANSTRASLLALLARHRKGPPTIAHIRDWAPEGRFPRFVHGLIARRADVVAANSAFVGSQFDGMPLRRPVRVLYNPIDLERFVPDGAEGAAVRGELRISAEAVTLTVVAQLTPLKGQDDAIAALAELVGSGADAVLLLVGSVKFASSGTQLDNVGFGRRLHEMAVELGVEDRVHFLGERADVPAILAATDVLLMPFWYDGFGRVAVEAMAMGVPVAASNVGGPAEVVRDGVDGVLVPPRRPEAWSSALKPLVDSRELREEMGRRGLDRAPEFSLEAQAAAALALYAELRR